MQRENDAPECVNSKAPFGTKLLFAPRLLPRGRGHPSNTCTPSAAIVTKIINIFGCDCMIVGGAIH